MGLLLKLKQVLPHPVHTLHRSYLTHRTYQVCHQEALTKLYPVQAGVPHGSILGPILYTIYTADLPEDDQTLTATFADDTAINSLPCRPHYSHPKTPNTPEQNRALATTIARTRQRDKISASHLHAEKRRLPRSLPKWKTPPPKSHSKIPWTTPRPKTTWKAHIQAKRKQLDLTLRKMYWIIGRKSELSLKNKVPLHETILKPIWTYGIPLWGTASHSNIEILQRFQNKILRAITNAPWYVPNRVLHTDLMITTIREEITRHRTAHINKLRQHTNPLIPTILEERKPKRLKRHTPADLTHRY